MHPRLWLPPSGACAPPIGSLPQVYAGVNFKSWKSYSSMSQATNAQYWWADDITSFDFTSSSYTPSFVQASTHTQWGVMIRAASPLAGNLLGPLAPTLLSPSYTPSFAQASSISHTRARCLMFLIVWAGCWAGTSPLPHLTTAFQPPQPTYRFAARCRGASAQAALFLNPMSLIAPGFKRAPLSSP